MIDLADAAGVIDKAGSWYSFDSQRLGQGRENVRTFLKENSQMAARIEAVVRQNAGLTALGPPETPASAGNEEGDDASEGAVSE